MKQIQRNNTSQIHPRIFTAMLALAALYVAATWFGFADGAYTDYLLMVVTGFIALSIALVALMWRVRRRYLPARKTRFDNLDKWARKEIDVAGTPVKGNAAAIETLLPIAAVAVGMAAFALVAHLVG